MVDHPISPDSHVFDEPESEVQAGDAVMYFNLDPDQSTDNAPMLVHNAIPSGGLIALAGPGSSGKTTLAMGLSHALAHGGGTFLGRRAERGSVIYFAIERFNLANRTLRGYNQVFGNTPNLALARWDNCHLVDEPDAAATTIRAAVARIQKKTKKRCVLIVIDTLSKAIPGCNEDVQNFSTIASWCEKLADELDITLMLIAHTGKDQRAGIRGSSTLAWGCSYVGMVKREQDIDINVGSLKSFKSNEVVDEDPIGYYTKIVTVNTNRYNEPVRTVVVEYQREGPVIARAVPDADPDKEWLIDALQIVLSLDNPDADDPRFGNRTNTPALILGESGLHDGVHPDPVLKQHPGE